MSTFVSYALALASEYCCITFAPARAEALADIRYAPDGQARILIPQVERYTTETIPGLPLSADVGAARVVGRPFPFDLFAAMKFWLADEGNRNASPEAWDAHDRLRPQASAQEARDLREVPIVNAYLMLLRAWMKTRLGIDERSRLPAGRSAIVVLSHDVDQPLHPADPRNRLWVAAQHLRRGEVRRGGRLATFEAARVGAKLGRVGAQLILRRHARHWLFSRIVDAEARHGFVSTFFFAATSKYDEAGTPLDVIYDIRSPRFRHLFRGLDARGAEIGLHISYGARDDDRAIAHERCRLSAMAGVEVLGSRHHFWHMTRPFWPTLHAHGRAGLRYDSSIGFNDEPGYRLGVALAFHPWDPTTGAAVKALQIPTMLMDGALFIRSVPPNIKVGEQLEGLLAGLKRYEGIAAIDWHDYTSYPASPAYAAWGRSYLDLLEVLSADPQIDVLSYRDLLARVVDRRAQVPLVVERADLS